VAVWVVFSCDGQAQYRRYGRVALRKACFKVEQNSVASRKSIIVLPDICYLQGGKRRMIAAETVACWHGPVFRTLQIWQKRARNVALKVLVFDPV
jgi:hypothetical protein